MRVATFKILSLLVAVLLPVSAQAERGDGQEFRLAMLSSHNGERARWNVPSLRWDNDLAEGARQHAAELARSGSLRHAAFSGNKAPGENLWMGTRGAYSYEQMMDMFLRERAIYTARVVPDISTTGKWTDAGHYSQIIWRTTTRVGCGFASGADYDVLVCRYDPAGNVRGRRADQDAPAPRPHRTQIAFSDGDRSADF